MLEKVVIIYYNTKTLKDDNFNNLVNLPNIKSVIVGFNNGIYGGYYTQQLIK